VDIESIGSLNTRLSSERRLECDACCFVRSSPEIVRDLDAAHAAQGLGVAHVVRDISRRGAIIVSEMQQRREVLPNTSVDSVFWRLKNYAKLAATRDWGEAPGPGRVREGKIPGDEVGRSIIGVAYCGYQGAGTIDNIFERSVGIDGRCRDFMGDGVFATVGIGDINSVVLRDFQNAANGDAEAYENLVGNKIEELKQRIQNALPGLSEATHRLVTEVLVVISMSHLFTARIVSGFGMVVQEMCEFLRINADNIKKAWYYDEESSRLLQNFDELRRLEEENMRLRRIVADIPGEQGHAVRAEARRQGIPFPQTPECLRG
jgi:hypothetical protein